MSGKVQRLIREVEALARDLGLEILPIEYEFVPKEALFSVASGGLPIRFHHWTHGREYYLISKKNRLGLSHLFEVFFYGRPSYAFIRDDDKPEDQMVVVAHCVGHSNFSCENYLFQKVDLRMVHEAIDHARRVDELESLYGEPRVEQVLDAALALQFNIDFTRPLNRPRYPEPKKVRKQRKPGEYDDLLEMGRRETETEEWEIIHDKVPPHDEYDLLWFLANYADLEDWEREILNMVREEAYYFYPIIRTKIMNEGWATFLELFLLKELNERKDFLTDKEFLEILRTHALVASARPSTYINPYYVGHHMWSTLHKRGKTLDELLQIVRTYDDLSFIRDFLEPEMAEEMGLFVHKDQKVVETKEFEQVKKVLMDTLARGGQPNIFIPAGGCKRNALVLHFVKDTEWDLDLLYAQNTLRYIQKLWKGPVLLEYLVEGDPWYRFEVNEDGEFRQFKLHGRRARR